MNVEAGDRTQRLERDYVDRDAGRAGEDPLERAMGRVADENGSNRESPAFNQPADDQTSFGNEQPAPLEELGVGDVAVVVEAGVVERVDVDGAQAVLRCAPL